MLVNQLSEKLKRGETHFGNHPVYSHELVAGALKPEFKRTVASVNSSSKILGYQFKLDEKKPLHPAEFARLFFQVEREIKERESKPEVKRKLELLARKSVQNVFGLSEDEVGDLFKKTQLADRPFEGSLPDEPTQEKGVAPEYSDKVREFIRRRHSHDLLINGLAISAMLHTPEMFGKELSKIDERLPQLYDLHSNLAQYSNFFLANEMQNLQTPRLKAGESKLEWDMNGGVKAQAVGFTFPILVQEMTKAVAETCMAHGLPQKLSERELAAWRKELHAPGREVWQFIAGKPVAEQTREMLLRMGFSGASFHDWLAKATTRDFFEEERTPRDTLAYSLMLLSEMDSENLENVIKKALKPNHPVDATKVLAKAEREL